VWRNGSPPSRSRPRSGSPSRSRSPAEAGRRAPAPDALTLAEETFLEHYLLTDNRTLAYRKAFPGCAYSTARSEGCKLLQNPASAAKWTPTGPRQRRRFRVTAARVIAKRAELAFSDIGDVVAIEGGVPTLRPEGEIPKEARRAVKTSP
jgi:phage terminase small subunit